jgi:uncharacterized membrane protein YhaH (DUF805 family)
MALRSGNGMAAAGMAGLTGIVGLLCCIAYLVLMVLPSQPGENRYGSNPYGDRGAAVPAE